MAGTAAVICSKEQINSNEYKNGSDPYQTDENNKDTGSRAKILRRIIKDYHSTVEEEIIKNRSKSRLLKSEEDYKVLDDVYFNDENIQISSIHLLISKYQTFSIKGTNLITRKK